VSDENDHWGGNTIASRRNKPRAELSLKRRGQILFCSR
jgi:hypothetical protein